LGQFPPGGGKREDDLDEDEPLEASPHNRRKSVFAETYDPEADTEEEVIPKHEKTQAQRASLTEAVKQILLFRSLDQEQVQQVIDAMFEKKVKKGEFVIKQGDDGDNFYVIQQGKFKAMVTTGGQEKVVGGYENAGSFGELALMYNMPRAASVQAESDGSLWALDRVTFRHIVLKSAYKKRKMYEALIDSVPMLKTLDQYERMNLADALVPRYFKDGERVINQGDGADGMFFIEDGSVAVVVNDKEISRIGKGGYFGELALLTKKPRAASIIAKGPLKTAFLDIDAFERLLGPCLDIMKRNAEDYEQQLLKIFGNKEAMTGLR